MIGVILGAMALTLSVSVLLALDLETYWTFIAQGVILLVAIGAQATLAYIRRQSTASTARRCRSDGMSTTTEVPVQERKQSPGKRGLVDLGDAQRGVYGVWAAFVLLLIVAAITRPALMQVSSLKTVAVLAAITAIVGLGQSAVIFVAGIDLSIPMVMTISGILFCQIANGDESRFFIALIVSIVVGIVIGLINGIGSVAGDPSRGHHHRGGCHPHRYHPGLHRWPGDRVAPGEPGQVHARRRQRHPRRADCVGRPDRGGDVCDAADCVRPPVAGHGVQPGLDQAGRRQRHRGGHLHLRDLRGLRGHRRRDGRRAVRSSYLGMGDPYLLLSVAVVALGGASFTSGPRGNFLGTLGGALLLSLLTTLLTTFHLSEGMKVVIQGAVILIAVIASKFRSKRD